MLGTMGKLGLPSLIASKPSRDRELVLAFLEVPDPMGEDGKRRVAATIGISNGVKAEVIEGLKEGDKVVLQ